jgi:hypothetical protein
LYVNLKQEITGMALPVPRDKSILANPLERRGNPASGSALFRRQKNSACICLLNRLDFRPALFP